MGGADDEQRRRLRHSTLVATRLLPRASKDTLAALALDWLTLEQRRPAKRQRVDSPDDSSSQVYAAPHSYSKARLVDQVQRDWPRGLSLDQLAQLDVHSTATSSARPWTTYRLVFSTPRHSTKSRSLDEWRHDVEDAFHPFYSNCHVYVTSTTPLALHFRIATDTLADSPLILHFLHFTSTPYILTHSLSPQHEHVVLQSLCTAFSPSLDRRRRRQDEGIVETIELVNVRGKSWTSIRERLIQDPNSGGKWKQFRPQGDDDNVTVQVEDGQVLAPLSLSRPPLPSHHERIVQHDTYVKTSRDHQISSCIGWSTLPSVERIEWQLLTSYLSSSSVDDDDESMFTIRLDGPSVFNGVRDLVKYGLVNDALPDWMEDVVVGGGEDVVQVGQVTESS